MPLWIRARSIVEEREVSAAVDEYAACLKRFDEAYEALKWLLARSGQKLGLRRVAAGVTYRLYRQASDLLAETPSIIVVYTCTDDEVNILALQAEAAATEG